MLSLWYDTEVETVQNEGKEICLPIIELKFDLFTAASLRKICWVWTRGRWVGKRKKWCAWTLNSSGAFRMQESRGWRSSSVLPGMRSDLCWLFFCFLYHHVVSRPFGILYSCAYSFSVHLFWFARDLLYKVEFKDGNNNTSN